MHLGKTDCQHFASFSFLSISLTSLSCGCLLTGQPTNLWGQLLVRPILIHGKQFQNFSPHTAGNTHGCLVPEVVRGTAKAWKRVGWAWLSERVLDQLNKVICEEEVFLQSSRHGRITADTEKCFQRARHSRNLTFLLSFTFVHCPGVGRGGRLLTLTFDDEATRHH